MATNTNTSCKYDHVTCKVLIRSGSPTLYQLTPKTENIGHKHRNFRRMTLGERNGNKENKTILLVGETGTGKSTLVNALVNYAMGVKWEDDVWFHIVQDEKRDQSESQTSDVMVYQIFGFEGQTLPYSLTIIDTPGFGSTTGAKEDEKISERLLELFCAEDGVHEVNVVGFVLKASECRLTDRQSYIFDSVMSLLGKDVEKIIVPLITHSNGRTPKNALKALEAANIKFAKDEKNQPVYFLFDNCQEEDRTEGIEDLKHADKISTKGMTHFTEFLHKSQPQNLKTTVEVLNERIRLTACIHNLQDRIDFIELKRKEIQQTVEALKKHEHQMKDNEEFTVEVDEVYKERENIDGGMRWLFFYEGATCCKVCEENCHYPGCNMAWSPSRCEVFKDGRCTVCTGKCPVSDHVKETWRFVNKTRKVVKTLEDMKDKYEQGKRGSEEKTSLLKNLQDKIKSLEADEAKFLEEAYQHVQKLEKIALNVDSLSTYVHLDVLIEKMKERKETNKVQKLTEMKCRVSEFFKAGKKYASVY